MQTQFARQRRPIPSDRSLRTAIGGIEERTEFRRI